ncbi:hypothetical protein BCH308197_2212 [Bacillus cereus H3081.97]|nr:hypothetical protein bcf_10860 [Bacillus cereus F837/76]EDZ57967.1 hypothetical protein BCH308197_2212 [Bacillus cereus H3081.97]KKZ91900.1 hypothetical protein B4086_2130 [Bacillus cereus]
MQRLYSACTRISELDADTHFYVMSSGTRKEKRDDIYFSKSV